jgi:hypothetical protein
VATKIAEAGEHLVWDSAVQRSELSASYPWEVDAMDAARELVSGTRDAVVLQQADGTFGVASATRSGPGLHAATADVFAVLGRNAQAGVSIRPTTDQSTRIEAVSRLFQAAGIVPEKSRAVLEAGLSAARSRALLLELGGGASGYRQYGPTLVATALLRQCAAAGGMTPTELYKALQGYMGLVVARPDGVLARALTGEALQRAGAVELRDGTLVAGAYEIGRFYANHGGVFYATDENLNQMGPPVGELALDTPGAARILDGIEATLVATLRGLYQLGSDPIGSLDGLQKLPAAVALLIANSSDYWERFRAMPVGDQTEEVARIASGLLMVVGGGVGAARAVSAMGNLGKITLPALSLSADGTLAHALVSIDASAAVTMLGSGPGAVVVLHTAHSQLARGPASQQGPRTTGTRHDRGAAPASSSAETTRLAKKWGLNASSPTTQQILSHLDTPIATFIARFRKAGIREVFPSEFLQGTVRDALARGGPRVRKLLLDGRFAR